MVTSYPLFKKIIISVKFSKQNDFFNLNELCIENYLYIYNIKLIEENTLLIIKKNPLLTQPNIFFRTKPIFHNSVPKHNFFFFFLKTPKTILKNHF